MESNLTLKNIVTETKNLRNEFKNQCETIGKQVLEVAFKEIPTLKLLVVTGYTPSWNDGDVCTHSQSVIVADEELRYSFEEDESIVGETIKEFGDEPINQITCKQETELVNAIENCEEFFEHLYQTNWRILVTRTTNGIKVVKEDYDPEY